MVSAPSRNTEELTLRIHRSTQEKPAELRQIASGNVETNISNARSRLNLGRTDMENEKDDQAMLRQKSSWRFPNGEVLGPFEVVERRNSDVKSALPSGEMWVDINNIKKFRGNSPFPI